MSVHARLAILAAVGAIMVSGPALAYVGPGAGLSMLGSLIAVVVAIFVAVLGLLLFPIRMLLKRRRGGATAGREVPASGGSKQQG
jgi:hypothetical protein